MTEADYSGVNGGYTASYKVNNAAGDPTIGRVAEITIDTSASAANIIDFFNYKQNTPPTGIMLDILPFVMIGVAAIGGLLVMAKKRKVEEK